MQTCPNGDRMGGRSCPRSGGSATVMSGVLRALSICVPVAIFDAPSTLAQTFEPKALGAHIAQATRAQALAVVGPDITVQPLALALAGFGRQTGLQIVYVSGVVRDEKSRAVFAGLGAHEAL